MIESYAMSNEYQVKDTQPVFKQSISPGDITQPTVPEPLISMDETQPRQIPKLRKRSWSCLGCVTLLGIGLGIIMAAFLFLPPRTNILLMGIDRTPPGTAVGRSDTLILTTVEAWKPYIGMLSIPRDLWVTIPGVGENRINAAHLFAESELEGSGPAAAVATVSSNIGVDVHYYVRIQFGGIQAVVDAIGGVPIDLDRPTVILPAGKHLLDGEMALTFLRDRKGSDDFFRMARSQLFLRALVARLFDPQVWPRLPAFWVSLHDTLETDIPIWGWPRIGVTLLRVGSDGVDARVIDREMVRGFTTPDGAAVLAPDWTRINPVLLEMFGQ
jgi:LCP family protein required for cell wall assembly